MNKKYMIGILAVLLLLPLACSQEYNLNARDNFIRIPSYVFTMFASDGQLTNFNIFGMNADITQTKTSLWGLPFNLPTYRSAYMIAEKIDDVPTWLSISCVNGFNKNISLGFSPHEETIPLLPDNSQIFSIIDAERNSIAWSGACSLLSTGSDVHVAFQVSENKTIIETSLYTIPNNAINEIVTNVSDTVTASISLLNMFLMAAYVLALFFFLIFIWKLIEYVYHWLRRAKE